MQQVDFLSLLRETGLFHVHNDNGAMRITLGGYTFGVHDNTNLWSVDEIISMEDCFYCYRSGELQYTRSYSRLDDLLVDATIAKSGRQIPILRVDYVESNKN